MKSPAVRVNEPLRVDLQVAWSGGPVPGSAEFDAWVGAALQGRRSCAEVSVRIVGEEEASRLNRDYRGRDNPTNVLAFPADVAPEAGAGLLGDLVLCGPLVAREALEQDKPLEAHWAHLVVHGTLHLVGFDHRDLPEARAMEALEVEILAKLGYPDPYCV